MNPNRTPLTETRIQEALATLPGWTHRDDRLEKTYELADFREAVGFIVRLAFEADRMDHHPELTNIYNRVGVALQTHDAGNQVTEMDVQLARHIEKLAGERSSS